VLEYVRTSFVLLRVGRSYHGDWVCQSQHKDFFPSVTFGSLSKPWRTINPTP
jgi:hypothetical protein